MILITGVAGFIGSFLAQKFLDLGERVVGIDNMNDYYETSLKKDRLNRLKHDHFEWCEVDLADKMGLNHIFEKYQPKIVVNLAAQAGVRYSLINPDAYISSNIVGFGNLLEMCKNSNVKHLIYASSSSVYGANRKIPFSVTDSVDHPVSLYAATKKSNELMAHTYSHLYGLPTTGLRFFTVYGPWGRPDMAYFSFTKNILNNEPIKVFNGGDLKRDFTFIDDIVEGIVKVAQLKTHPILKNSESGEGAQVPYKVYNIGNNTPVPIMYFIETLENLLGKKAIIEYAPMQPGDVKETYADISDLQRDTGFTPSTSINEGLQKFVEWYLHYYKIHQFN
ncbi:NAD-dependent epimerase [Paenibacillus chitinolyticus]|uniref:NAD-dependent epimerase n=1 Tax=Paenibacillus chitinolyticus TaxID=79263 RepID=UPI003D032E59